LRPGADEGLAVTLQTGEIPGWLNGYKAMLDAEYALRVALWVCPNVEDAMKVYKAWLAHILERAKGAT
jgi:hypothetical protein